MKDGTEYYPVKLVASYNLDNLPPEDVFLKDFEEKQCIVQFKSNIINNINYPS